MNVYQSRFESKYEPIPEAGCWLWTGALIPKGYGHFLYEGTLMGAHRASYKMFVGEIPPGLQIDHLCRVRCCVNPNHLEAVTPKENSARIPGPWIGGVMQRAKTHCKHGHPYGGANLVIDKYGYRECRACIKARHYKYQQKQKAAV